MTEQSYLDRLRTEPLEGLRALRESLQEEERRVSYWRRLVQGRLDLVRAGLMGIRPTAADLANLAAVRERPTGQRRSPAATDLGAPDIPNPVGGLEALWDTPLDWNHLGKLGETERLLVEAEVELSVYRRILHQRIDACTAELVARYQRDPSQLAGLTTP